MPTDKATHEDRNKVVLRRVQESDLPVFFVNQREPDAVRMADFPSRDFDEFMAHWSQSLANDEAILRTIVAGNEVAGNIVCWRQNGFWNVGYWLGRQFWNRGIATAALAQFVKQIDERPLYARVAETNLSSKRVLEKCGFAACGKSAYQGLTGEPATEILMKLEKSGGEGHT